MAILYLIRHGEPELRGVFLGRMDSPLSAAGHFAVKSALAGLVVQVTYTSPLSRAAQTAAYLSSAKTIQVPDLCELGEGEWTGKTWAEIEAGWSDIARLKSADWLGIAAPGGESWECLVHRVARVWDTIRKGPEPCAVVAHQGVNAALASLISETNPLQFAQQYGEVIRFEYA